MRRTLLLALLLLCAGCPRPDPPPDCQPSDGGTTLDTPCAGKPDGTKCCLGAQKGTCHSNRCVADGPPQVPAQ